MRKSAGTGTFTLGSVTLNNSGNVDVQHGKLYLSGEV